jgi:hypothetical protein
MQVNEFQVEIDEELVGWMCIDGEYIINIIVMVDVHGLISWRDW